MERGRMLVVRRGWGKGKGGRGRVVLRLRGA